MATSGTRGAGITIGYADTAQGQATAIAQILDVDLPQVTTDKVDVTSGEDATDATKLFKRIIAGWAEAGEASFDIIYKKAQAATLYGLRGVAKYWTITAVDGSTWKFQGFLANLGASAPMKDVIKQKVTVAVDGEVTFAAGV
jgi:hypothetical protein